MILTTRRLLVYEVSGSLSGGIRCKVPNTAKYGVQSSHKLTDLR